MDPRTRHVVLHLLAGTIIAGLLAASLLVLPGGSAAAATQDCLGASRAEWSSTEAWIWNRLCTDSVADLNEGTRFGRRPTMADPATWSARRTVGAAFLEAIILDSSLTDFLADRPIFILGVRATEPVDLSAADAKVSIYLYDNRFDGAITLVDAVFEKNFGISGSFFAQPVEARGLDVRGSMWLDTKTEFVSLDLQNANIGGSLNATGVRVHGAFGANGATIQNTLGLDDADLGAADLSFTTVGGDLAADGAHVGQHLGLDAARIRSVYLKRADLRDLDLSLSIISGFVDLAGARVKGDVGATNATISGSLILAEGKSVTKWSPRSTLDLRGASVGDIEDDPQAWPREVLLGGFRYSLLSGDHPGEEAVFADQPVTWYEGWLHRDPTYTRSAYRQLEASLRALGRDGDADRIAMASKDEESHQASFAGRAVALLYKVTVGYGYRPQRAIYAAILFVLIGTVVARRLPADRGAPSKLMLSVQRFTPFLSFGDAYNKVDTTSSAVPTWVRRYFYVHTVVGYVLAAFLLAALGSLTTV